MLRRFFLALAVAAPFSLALAQTQGSGLPAVSLKDLDGQVANSSTFLVDGKPTVISFWALWCKPCIQELSAINEQYADLHEETGVRVIAVSIDDARNAPKVKTFVNGKGWEFDVFLDPNQDLKRALNVNNAPHTFVYDAKGQVIAQHNQYLPGDEEQLFEEIRKAAKTR